jgi:hypothetical protein
VPTGIISDKRGLGYLCALMYFPYLIRDTEAPFLGRIHLAGWNRSKNNHHLTLCQLRRYQHASRGLK